jgi:hypothetical protein
MKNKFSVLFILFSFIAFGQQLDDTNAIELSFLRGNIMPHSPELYHLITGHPEGFLLSFSRKTHGKEEWQKLYNYPDYGGYFIYQDFKNEILGKNYAIGAHYNFYFLNRKVQFKIAQGIAMTTNPYDKVENSKNRAFGSKYMGNTNFIVNLGVNYDFCKKQLKTVDTVSISNKFTEPIKFNFVFRSGFNESIVIGSGQKPFYHLSFYADKRLSKKSALQFGTELFMTTSIKEYIKFRSIAYPDDNIDPSTDYKRVGIFVGHELFINRVSLETQLGYYVYRPFDLDVAIYDRLGIKYYWTPKIYSGIAVKTHGFLAEATEFSVGVRL